MSAICGIYQRDGKPVTSQALEPILQDLQHYGLDGRSIWEQGCVTLGHLMTRITPESFHEQLPFENSASELTITADAHLDNREELFSHLRIPALEQADIPDSQLILKAYQHWGTDCPIYLLGDFAFAIYDASNRRLFCARDILGIKPFYYYSDRGVFCFSSDIAALLNSPLVPEELNLSYVRAYLDIPHYSNKEYTFYKDIYKLPPANSMVIEPDKITREEYWSPGKNPEIRFQQEAEYVECLRELLNNSVSCRLRSAYPIGSHLSSGLDSSTVSVVAARFLRQKNQSLHTFSWAPPPGPEEYPLNDERAIVEAISNREQTLHHYTKVTPQAIFSMMKRDITRLPTETLLFESIICPQAAQHGLRVMLSGWGGDEIVAFNGRGYFADLLRRGHWITMSRELYLRARLHQGNFWQGLRNDAILPLLPDSLIRLIRPTSHKIPHALPLPASLQPAFADQLLRVEPLRDVNLRERPGVRNNQIRLLLSGHLVNRIESWAANGALSGMEYRYPLLDRRIIEFSLSIPETMFFQNGWKRYLFRLASHTILPEEARWQKMKVDAALIKNSPNNQIEAFKMVQEELILRIDEIQSRGYVNPDKIIQALATPENADNNENFDQLVMIRSIWLAFIESTVRT